MSGVKESALRREEAERNSIDLEECAALLGGEVDGQFIRCASPGFPPDDRSCWVRITPPSSIFIYACEGDLGAAYRTVRKALGIIDLPSPDRSDLVRRIWDETVPAPGTLVERYLRSRAITLPVPDALRFHPKLRHSPTKATWPAMVAARTDATGAMAAIHRTYLNDAMDGARKLSNEPKMDLGPAKGTAIRLSPLAEELVIGEGIETTLSVIQVQKCAGWAAGSAVALATLILPDTVRRVTVLADGDDAGRRASKSAALRWQREGRSVRLAEAPDGKDFNDLLRAL